MTYLLDQLTYLPKGKGITATLCVKGHNPLFPEHLEYFKLDEPITVEILANAEKKAVALMPWSSTKIKTASITLRAELRPETKNCYWYAFKKVAGKTKKFYIGTKLTNENLNKVIERFHQLAKC